MEEIHANFFKVANDLPHSSDLTIAFKWFRSLTKNKTCRYKIGPEISFFFSRLFSCSNDHRRRPFIYKNQGFFSRTLKRHTPRVKSDKS